ncbi:MAG: UDP-N-acetylmuramoyl-L-alanine--D-glutamate ligase [Candidatus Omnitrophica bacterium]|nr:UDP-N-acetylmuramoyl-L-alanine--D-glutamate ligase [Candidatus Omnitrophota bacterium]
MELKDKRVTVVGLGISGEAAAKFLHEHNAKVRVTDKSDNPQVQQDARALKDMGIECELGEHREAFLEGSELIVVSPGVDNSALPVKWADERGIPVISEIELGYRFCRAPIIAVSGTNGKSTVTSLIGQMFTAGGRDVYICGNIGVPFTSVVSMAAPEAVVVLEISSFQLERIDTFSPHIAVMLNITQDHLDRYANFDEYANAKLRLFSNQKAADYAIVNYDQAKFKDLSAKSKLLYFSKRSLPKKFEGVFVENEELLVRRDGRYIWLAAKEELSLSGEHNLENALASGLAALISGVEPNIIKETLCHFKGLSHRFELVDTINGIKFVDDSKATNVDSVKKAVQSSSKGIILIAGGRDKSSDYRILAGPLKEKVKSMLLIGEAREKIKKALSGAVPISFAESLEEAVKTAFGSARNGDTVLLSPMCSSFDMFRDYKERGEVFRNAVNSLKRSNKDA